MCPLMSQLVKSHRTHQKFNITDSFCVPFKRGMIIIAEEIISNMNFDFHGGGGGEQEHQLWWFFPANERSDVCRGSQTGVRGPIMVPEEVPGGPRQHDVQRFHASKCDFF